MKPYRLILFLFLIIQIRGNAQEVYLQTIKGVVRDIETNLPISNVNVMIKESDSLKNQGVITNLKGEFYFKYTYGRHKIIFSHISYENQSQPILITAGQELRMDIFLAPQVSQLSEIVINVQFQKEKPVNKLAYTSGRSFSTEEANRYAGTLGDPARMVQSYAGVTAAKDERNDIIIRGNSPTGLQWKLNDIEIPNPNHYGGVGLTGNHVTLLNMNMIDNSDFLTGAFPAEYGNVLSGVFDLKLKEGNPDKHEFHFQTGWNGFELGAEGPFSKKKNLGSHTSSYRYSFLDLLSKMGANIGIVPEYQDFTSNLHFKLSQKMELTVLSLWGTSNIELDDHDQENLNATTGDHIKTGSDLLLAGVNLTYKIDPYSKLKFSVSALQSKTTTDIDTFNVATDVSASIWDEISTENKYAFFSEYSIRSVNKNYFKAGLRWDTYNLNYKQDGVNWNDTYTTLTNSDATMHLLRLFAQDEYRISPLLKATLGVNFQYLHYNRSYGLEPRAGLQYNLNQSQSIAFAYGKHSQMQPRTIYFVETPTSQGIELSNKNLDFSRADHYVLSYNDLLTKDLRIKVETYYQYLYNIPVKDDPTSVYSILNTGAGYFVPLKDSLVNKGKGRNYGLELTVEKFLSNNYYCLLSGSVFSSEYSMGNGFWRSTSFDMSYIVNGLFGYEWWTSDKFALGTDVKMTSAGGKPYTPVDEQASMSSGEVIYDYDNAYSVKYDDYFRTDVKIYYRYNMKKTYLTFAIDLQNVTNNKNIHSQTFEPETGRYKTYYQRGIFPMFTFKMLF